MGNEKLFDKVDTLELKQFFKYRNNFQKLILLKNGSLNSDTPLFDKLTYKTASIFVESSLNFRLSAYFN